MNNEDFYTCKICRDSLSPSNQQLCKSNEPSVVERNVKKSDILNEKGQIELPRMIDYDHTSPKKILDEELSNNCLVCDVHLSGDTVNCLQCDNECHMTCTDISDVGEAVCTGCIASNNQKQMLENPVTKIPDPICVTAGTNQDTICADNTSVTDNISVMVSAESQDKDDACILIPKNSKYPSKDENNRNKTDICNQPEIDLPTTSANMNGNSQKNKEIKQSELRAKENKLRKREEEVKIKEKILEDMDNERVWFKSHINKLEFKINELQKSNDMLRKQVQANTDSDPSHQATTTNSTNNTSSAASRINRIQERVTNMILNQVEQQFLKFESMFETNTTCNNFSSVSDSTTKTENSHNIESTMRDIHQVAGADRRKNTPGEEDCFIISEEPPTKLPSVKEKEVEQFTSHFKGQPLFYQQDSTQFGTYKMNTNNIQKTAQNSTEMNRRFTNDNNKVKGTCENKSEARRISTCDSVSYPPSNNKNNTSQINKFSHNQTQSGTLLPNRQFSVAQSRANQQHFLSRVPTPPIRR